MYPLGEPLSALLPPQLAAHLPELALAAALAWGAGIRLYAAVFMFGLAHRYGWWELPAQLELLAAFPANGRARRAVACSRAPQLSADPMTTLPTTATERSPSDD